MIELTECKGYFLDEDGNIYNKYGHKLKLSLLPNGYLRVDLPGRIRPRIHRLVAKYFIPNPDNKPQVNHIDGNKQNNKVNNLQWVTNQENMIHAVKNGLTNYKRSKEIGKRFSSIPMRPVKQINSRGIVIMRYPSVWDAKRKTGIQISGCLAGRYKTAGGYKWEYLYDTP
jgi:HNH endonuclease